MKRLEDVVKQLLVEHKDQPSPLKEIYERSAERVKMITPGAETADVISARYGSMFKKKKS